MTTQLESFKNQPTALVQDFELFPDLDVLSFENFASEPKPNENQDFIEDTCSDQEKLMFLMNQSEIGEHKESFRYLGKMTMCMKTMICNSEELNPLERYMLEAELTPNDCKNIFQNTPLTQLSNAMKR